MAVMDEFKEERERMKTQPFKVRFAHFGDYHKYHVLAAAFALFMIGEFIYSKITATETVFMTAFIDCYTDINTSEEYENKLMNIMGIDPKEEDIILDTYSISSTQQTGDTSAFDKLSVHMAAHELDVFMAPEDMFRRYSNDELFYDLREILTADQLEKYQDDFYYIDYALIESGYYEEILFSENGTPLAFTDSLDHSNPKTMEKPIPVGIYLTGNKEFQDYYKFYTSEDQEVVFGVACYCDEQAINYGLQFLDIVTAETAE